MEYQIAGTLLKKYETNQYSESFKRKEFVVEVTETGANDVEYTQYVKMQVTQDRCAVIDNTPEGAEITVHFNIRGNKYEKNGETMYFTTLEAWKIDKEDAAAPPPAPAKKATVKKSAAPPPPAATKGPSEEEFGDLPF
jgi:hypothetical protein